MKESRALTNLPPGFGLCASVLLLALGACGGGGSGRDPGNAGHAGMGGAAGAGGQVAGAPGGMAGMAGQSGGDAGPAPSAFEPLPPHVAGSKVKRLLTGLPLSGEELTALSTGTGDLRDRLLPLIEQWMARPEWRAQLLAFFQQAFQQTQTDIADYDEQIGRNTGAWINSDRAAFLRAAEESFARTVLALIDEGAPLTAALTTERFLLNPPLMSTYAYMDAVPLNDRGRPLPAQLWLLTKYPQLTFERTAEVIPVAESINPQSPNFMRWTDARPYTGNNPERCLLPQSATGVQALRQTVDFLFGGRPGCGSTDSQWAPADWQAWRWVTVRPPVRDEERTVFWDLPKLRDPSTQELVLATPRVGFMTTPAFFANWPTNPSNAYRVTTNQALIVALGRSFDDRDLTVPVSESTSDADHVQPGSACYACHISLDPMRDFFRQSYSISYFQQFNTRAPDFPVSASFSVDGSTPVVGNGIRTLATAMAGHPRFGPAWTQKLCAFANAAPCSESDPEFLRVVAAFVASNFDWNALVRELFSSPLVTFARAPAEDATASDPATIARREAFCTALENRLGLADVCGLRGMGSPDDPRAVLQLRRRALNLAMSIPGAGYARGDVNPLLPRDPNLFFQGATENLCLSLATALVDTPSGQNRFTSTDPAPSVANLVALLAGLPPGDPRAAEMTAILNEHFTEARATGVTAREAMQSTFLLACESPFVTSMGL